MGTIHNKDNGLFGYLLLLTAIFMAMEISIFIQASHYYLGDYQFISNHLKIPLKVVPSILFFIFSQLLIHVIFTLIIWLMTRLIALALQCPFKTTLKIGVGLWFLGIAIVLLANQYYFPNSKYTYLTRFLFDFHLLEILLIIFSIVFLLAILLAIKGVFVIPSKLLRFTFLASVMGFGIAKGLSYSHALAPRDAATLTKPNIILIGIDSLRPDFLGYFGYEKISPHLDEFLNHATVFSQSFTPLARTFPSWISILTGLYPKNNGIRFNLAALHDQEKLWQMTLPSILGRDGYETIFSTDETRFSNIDTTMGFNKVITPPMGFNDFLIGTMNDFPMSNLLINTTLGGFLFPFSHANRPVFTTYDPNTFLDILKNQLPSQRVKPLFLAIHFCLPHAPYIWRNQLFSDNPLKSYQASINRMDQQFKDFLSLLKQKMDS